MSNRNLSRSTGYCLSASLLLAVAASSAWADPADPVNPLQKRFLTEDAGRLRHGRLLRRWGAQSPGL
jgi:hypothetical protein